VAFCCACLLGICFFALPLFCGAGSVICQLPPGCQCVVMVRCLFFNFAEPFDFGCCSLAQEMSFVVHYMPCFRQCLSLACFWPSCLSSRNVQVEISSLLPPPSQVYFQHFHLFCCVLVSQFIVYCSVLFCFVFAGGSVCPGGYAGLSQGWLGEYCVTLSAHLFGLPNVSQAGLELATAVVMVVAASAYPFSQCNVVWRSFVRAMSSGC
jgi:hypothetical protein